MRPKKLILLYCADRELLSMLAFVLRLHPYHVTAVEDSIEAALIAHDRCAAFACSVLIHAQQGDLAGRLVHRILNAALPMPLLLVDRAGDLAPVRYADMVLYGRNTSMAHILSALQILCRRKPGAPGKSAVDLLGWEDRAEAEACGMNYRILTGDVLARLRELPDESVQCVVTSPPYWGLRDYGVAGQIGQEKTPEEYTLKLVEVFHEVRRVLRQDGTCWLNLGDTYAGYWGDANAKKEGRRSSADTNGWTNGFHMNARPSFHEAFDQSQLKPKDLVGVPWMLAFALRADGWWLRQGIIWHKPNPMPESVTDRPTKSHEYLFLLTKSSSYYYDAEAIKEPLVRPEESQRKIPAKFGGAKKWEEAHKQSRLYSGYDYTGTLDGKRNKRSVWTIAVEAFSEAHFATFPTKLVEPCILAGTSEHGCCANCGAPWMRMVKRSVNFQSGSGRAGNVPEGKYAGSIQAESGDYDIRLGPVVTTATVGWEPSCKCEAGVKPCTVLDPFNGAGTTGLVALRLGRNYIGIELNPEYVAMSERRIREDAPLFRQEVQR